MMTSREIKNKYTDLKFDEPTHEYTVNGKRLIAASNVVHGFVDEFDTQGIAQAVANRDGKTKEEVIQGWDNINKKAIDLGNETHLFAEKYAYARFVEGSDLSEHIADTPQKIAVIKYWNDMPNHIVPAGFELQMYSKNYEFAGTCDILLYNSITQKYILADYKTNKDIFKNYKGKMMLPPFHYMLDMYYNHYQIQLSLYHMLLEEAGFEVESRQIVWLQSDSSYVVYGTKDFRKMLKTYFNEDWRRNTACIEFVL